MKSIEKIPQSLPIRTPFGFENCTFHPLHQYLRAAVLYWITFQITFVFSFQVQSLEDPVEQGLLRVNLLIYSITNVIPLC